MKLRDKEPEDKPWIRKILSERWGRVQVIVHNDLGFGIVVILTGCVNSSADGQF